MRVQKPKFGRGSDILCGSHRSRTNQGAGTNGQVVNTGLQETGTLRDGVDHRESSRFRALDLGTNIQKWEFRIGPIGD